MAAADPRWSLVSFSPEYSPWPIQSAIKRKFLLNDASKAVKHVWCTSKYKRSRKMKHVGYVTTNYKSNMYI